MDSTDEEIRDEGYNSRIKNVESLLKEKTPLEEVEERLREKYIQSHRLKIIEDRSYITRRFLYLYFAVLFFSFVFVYFYNWLILRFVSKMNYDRELLSHLLDFKDVVFVVTSNLAAALGFIIGYYFKNQSST